MPQVSHSDAKCGNLKKEVYIHYPMNQKLFSINEFNFEQKVCQQNCILNLTATTSWKNMCNFKL